MKLINLTPHAVRIRLQEDATPTALDSDIVIQASGNRAMISQSYHDMPLLNGSIPQAETDFGEITDLPEPEDGVIYVVSMPLAQYAAALGRYEDIRFPDTGRSAIRTVEGQPYAVRRLLMARVIVG